MCGPMTKEKNIEWNGAIIEYKNGISNVIDYSNLFLFVLIGINMSSFLNFILQEMYQIDDYKYLLLQAQYWQDDCERGQDLYELTEQVLKSDLREGNVFIISK